VKLPVNAFKQALLAGRQQIGLWNTVPGPVVIEALATCGFDWVVIDTEHALTDVPDVMAMMQALAAYPVSPVVRPVCNDTVLIKRLLDLGAQTLLIPYVQTVEEAEAAVRAMHYAPRGVRGVSGMMRANRFGTVADYHAQAADALCLIVQIETVAAVERIAEIAAVEGVDGLFVGPADLGMSMGRTGGMADPEVRAMAARAIRAIVAAGKPAGILSLDPQLAQDCIGWGSTFTAVGVDLSLLTKAARQLREQFQGG
jgi:4-hydroxy-2-oxoheptanedioate aldolase